MTAARPRIVVAPDKFKGSLTAVAAARAIAHGLERNCPDAELVLLPVADAGTGPSQPPLPPVTSAGRSSCRGRRVSR